MVYRGSDASSHGFAHEVGRGFRAKAATDVPKIAFGAPTTFTFFREQDRSGATNFQFGQQVALFGFEDDLRACP